jgi:hypothetical protein
VTLSLQKGNDLSDVSLANVEALTQTENGWAIIQCYCKQPAHKNPYCSTYGNGNLCAQSPPGGNVDCANYNSNCRKD